MSAELVADYLPLEQEKTRGFAYAAAAPWLEATLRHQGTLRAWASSGTPLGGGRTTARALPAPVNGPGGATDWVCRAYRRGGAAALLLGDRYLRAGEPRPFAELRASSAARARGVRTPAVVAAAVYLAGPFYRADLVTERVPRVRTLADALFAAEPVAPPSELLIGAGRLLASLERARVMHRDLNATNILVPAEPFAPDFWVVDLDRCTVLPPHAPPPAGPMRRRLERSLVKLGRRHRASWRSDAWEPLRRGYEDGA